MPNTCPTCGDTNLHVKGTGTDVLKIESTDAGAQGTNLILQHSPGSGNMADDDVISLKFKENFISVRKIILSMKVSRLNLGSNSLCRNINS